MFDEVLREATAGWGLGDAEDGVRKDGVPDVGGVPFCLANVLGAGWYGGEDTGAGVAALELDLFEPLDPLVELTTEIA